MDKLERSARRIIADLGVKILSCRNMNGHYYLQLELPGGAERRITMPSSPKNEGDCLKAVARNVRMLVPPTTEGSTMKLYKTTYNTDVVGANGKYITAAVWEGSADAASKGRSALRNKLPDCKPTTEAVDVPTDKAGLLAWLNKS